MIYSELIGRIGAVIADDFSTDTDWQTYAPAIIEQAELRCYRDIDFLFNRVTTLMTLAVGVATFAAPSDWLLGETIRLTETNAALDRRDSSFLDEYGGIGKPKYWAEPVQGTIQVAPVPTIPFAAEFTYHARPAAMTQANPVTSLGTVCPDLFFYACMVSVTGYLRNYGSQADDPKMAMSWEQQYQTALASVKREEGRRKGDSPSFDGSLAPPPISNTP